MADVIVLGGPNGAGETTAAPGMLSPELGIREFVNADEIAIGISPLNPEDSEIAAGRVLLERIHALAVSGESFGFETTCAGRGHAKLLRRCQSAGYRVTLIFLWLRTPDMAVARVARRKAAGGHGVDAAVVVRRYWAGLRNLRELYLPLSDVGLIYDNSDDTPVLVAESAGPAFVIRDSARWQMIEEVTR